MALPPILFSFGIQFFFERVFFFSVVYGDDDDDEVLMVDMIHIYVCYACESAISRTEE